MSECCETSCCEPISTSTPGATGATGAAGTDGEDGISAFALVANYNPAAQPAMPTSGNDVDVEYTSDISAFAVGQIVYQQNWGWMRVMAIVDNVTLTLRNLETATEYTENAIATTLLAASSRLVGGAMQGPAGTPAASPAPPDATYITQTPNGTLTNEQALSTLATGLLLNTTGTGVLSIASAGTEYLAPAAIGVTVQGFDATLAALAAANWAANALPIGTGADALAQTAFAANTFPARASAGNLIAKAITDLALALLDDAAQGDMQTTLGLVLGTNVQAFNDLLAAVAALAPTVADRYIYTTGVNTVAAGTITPTSRALLVNASIQTWNAALGGLIPRYGRLGSINTGNMNSTADITLAVDAYVANTRYRIDKIMVENASISLTTATAGVFTAAGGGGTTVAATQALSALTSSSKWLALTLEAITGTDVFTASPLYFRVVTPQGAAATANVHLFGWSFDDP